MKKLSNKPTENDQMQALLEEANRILAGTTDLNQEKEKLGSILGEIMYWNDKENDKYEEFYLQFSEMIKAMHKVDFSKRLSPGVPMSFMNLIAFALNTVNEELKEKALPVRMFHSLLEGLNLKKNSLLLITDAEGLITFVHTNIDKPHFSKEALIGQSLTVLFQEDYHKVDSLIKKEGTLKNLNVKMNYDKTGSVTLRLVLPTIIDTFEGIAYVITIPDKK